MGCDGGTIPRRDELVKTKKKAEAKDKNAELAFQWLCCAISQQLLAAPVVMCGLGRLYNKESVIEGLLNRSSLPETAKHIKNLKDLKELKLAPNPEYKPDDEKKEGSTDEKACPYICPIIGLEMSGKFKFVALWSCGCVFSERAFKEIGDKICVNCQIEFTEDDVVILNAKDEDLELMTKRMEKRQAKVKKNKGKKLKIKTEPVSIVQPEETTLPTVPGSSTAPQHNVPVLSSEVPSAVTDPVSASQNCGPGEQAHATTGVKRPLKPALAFTVGQKKTKRELSVAEDPQKSDVYKSLFTSHKSEQEQNRAHWVTYNPFYN